MAGSVSVGDKISCLYRIAGIKDSTELFELPQNIQEVLIGRGVDCDFTLSSLKLSRQHAKLEQIEPRTWKITDLGSTNGIWINGKKLEKNESYVLEDRDKVELGKDPSGRQATEFVYQFYKAARVKKRSSDVLSPSGADFQKMQKLEEKLQQKQEEEAAMKKRFEELENMLKEKDAEKEKYLELEERLRQNEEEKEQEKQRLEELVRMLQEKEENERRLRQLQDKLSEKEEENKLRIAKMELMHKKLEQDMKEKEMSAFENEKNLQEQMKKAEEERLALNKEREQISQQLQQEMNGKQRMAQEREECMKRLEEIQSKAEQRGAQDQERLQQLQQVLQSKETEIKTLVIHKSSLEAEGTGVKATIEEMMESELVCAICSELFVQAVSLNCSHSYCQLCISKWVKKKNECPQCRSMITSHVRSLVLDNYIDKVSEFLSEQTKEKRKKLVAERKEEQKEWDAHQAATGTPQPVSTNLPGTSADSENQYIIIDNNTLLTTNLPFLLNLPIFNDAQITHHRPQTQVRPPANLIRPQTSHAQVRPNNTQVRPQVNHNQVRPPLNQVRNNTQVRPQWHRNQAGPPSSQVRPPSNQVRRQTPAQSLIRHGQAALRHPHPTQNFPFTR